jgi:hypothetical protein
MDEWGGVSLAPRASGVDFLASLPTSSFEDAAGHIRLETEQQCFCTRLCITGEGRDGAQVIFET